MQEVDPRDPDVTQCGWVCRAARNTLSRHLYLGRRDLFIAPAKGALQEWKTRGGCCYPFSEAQRIKPDPLGWVTGEYRDTRGYALNQLPRSLHKIRSNKCASAASSLCLGLVCACHSRSGPAPSPRTRTRVMTTPATASSFIWMRATRFSLSWMGAKLTGATATNTAPFQGSSSTLTEDGLRSVRSQSPRAVGVWLSLGSCSTVHVARSHGSPVRLFLSML